MGLTGSNILVTGGTGFLGSHLVESLFPLSANIIVTDEGEENPHSYFYRNKLHKNSTLVHLDIKDFKRALHVITKYKIDYVFHLAAQAEVGTAFKNPLETYESNVMGTVNILESCRLYGETKGIIVSSSDKAYGKLKRATETNPLSGDHPYETSKSAADLIAHTYFVSFKLPIAITRFGNTYGEGDLNFSRIIPGIMESVIKNKTLEIRSNGKLVRDYVYVGDIVKAIIAIAKKINSVKGEAFNVSSTENLSVIDIVKRVGTILGRKVNYEILNMAINEIPVQSINFNKIRKTLGWKPKENLSSTIPAIYEWYSKYFQDKN